KEPGLQLATDLHTLKQILETGQASTVEGQPSARPHDTPPAHTPRRPEKDTVQRGSEASFPASDPPAWMAGAAIPEPDDNEQEAAR
ncbi:MAG TPA: hypothetical protein VFT99_25730, partial [Roseiflexaceae bacterium]|nr:hypothetical protein [Roseiflexaceae bacterium]